MTRTGRKEPLYRKVNTLARGVRHPAGGEARWDRNTKAEAQAAAEGVTRGKLRTAARFGAFDYTPLFRFLLSRVGQDWAAVHAEAMSRLDREAPIFWIVALHPQDRRPVVRIGESTYFTGLYVTEDGRLARVDPDLTAAMMRPFCACCTHTLNGQPFGLPFDPAQPPGLPQEPLP